MELQNARMEQRSSKDNRWDRLPDFPQWHGAAGPEIPDPERHGFPLRGTWVPVAAASVALIAALIMALAHSYMPGFAGPWEVWDVLVWTIPALLFLLAATGLMWAARRPPSGRRSPLALFGSTLAITVIATPLCIAFATWAFFAYFGDMLEEPTPPTRTAWDLSRIASLVYLAAAALGIGSCAVVLDRGIEALTFDGQARQQIARTHEEEHGHVLLRLLFWIGGSALVIGIPVAGATGGAGDVSPLLLVAGVEMGITYLWLGCLTFPGTQCNRLELWMALGSGMLTVAGVVATVILQVMAISGARYAVAVPIVFGILFVLSTFYCLRSDPNDPGSGQLRW